MIVLECDCDKKTGTFCFGARQGQDLWEKNDDNEQTI